MSTNDSAVVVFGQGARRDGRRMRGGPRAVGVDAAPLLCALALEAANGSGADVVLAGDEDLAASRPGGVSFIIRARPPRSPLPRPRLLITELG